MKRRAENELINWKNSSGRKPLILRGARQVGKTWLVENFGKLSFKNYIKIDFERQQELIEIFEKNLDVKRIISDLEIILQVKITPPKTLLFFDEIQNAPNAIKSLRYFYEEMPELFVIAAGSLLEFAISEISFPVGRVNIMDLQPMSFSEFILAGENKSAIEIISNKPEKLSEPIHKFMINELKKYFFTGGLPEAVKEYYSSKSYQNVSQIHSELNETYRLDFAKYKPHVDNICLNEVINKLSGNVGNQIKYTKLSDSFSGTTTRKAFNSLEMARLITKIPAVSAPQKPLKFNASEKKFKCISIDIGLMNNLLNMGNYALIVNNDLMGTYKGALAEQFIGQELRANKTIKDIYYWARDSKSSNAEVDYLIEIDNKIIPIEVKQGPAGKLKSLHMYRENYNPEHCIVFYAGEYNYLSNQNIYFVPLYFSESFTNI